jgi:hypothetical protein
MTSLRPRWWHEDGVGQADGSGGSPERLDNGEVAAMAAVEAFSDGGWQAVNGAIWGVLLELKGG